MTSPRSGARPGRHARCVAALVLFLAACHGCESSGGRPAPGAGVAAASLTVTSRAFASNGHIPVDQTCDGADKSPQLAWSAPPAGTRTFAVLVDDPDAPGGTFTHWLAYDLPGDRLTLPEEADLSAMGAVAAANDFGRPGYSGPCPPRGDAHRYYFRVYALDTVLPASPQSRSAVLAAMSGHVLAEGALMGTFSR